MKKVIIVTIMVVLGISFADAQRKKSNMFDADPGGVGYAKDQLYLGATLGYGYGPAIGVEGEYTITDKQWVAIGVGAQMAYHLGFSDDYTWYNYTGNGWYWEPYTVRYSMFSFNVFGTYHLFPHKKFDVFGRLGFGYRNWFTTTSGNAPSVVNYSYSSGVGEIVEACIRYYLTPNLALRASVGEPVWLSVGIDLRLF